MKEKSTKLESCLKIRYARDVTNYIVLYLTLLVVNKY